jgi:hypothetical protein
MKGGEMMGNKTYAGKITNKSSQYVEAIFKQGKPKGSKITEGKKK